MRVKTSLDWEKVSPYFVAQMHSAPLVTQKDLAKMLGNITGLVNELSREEVLLRNKRKFTSPHSQQLIAKINESIEEYEKWLMFAHLSNG